MKKTHLQIALEGEAKFQLEEQPAMAANLTVKAKDQIIEETANRLIKDEWLWEQINERICDTIAEIIAEKNLEVCKNVQR